jgi:hypothetical protein
VKRSCAEVLNLCADDSRVADYVNAGCERLLYRAKSVGTWQKYRVCVSSGCVTWPRQLETIEAVAVCNSPIKVRNEFFEFLDAGFGLISTDSCGLKLVDQGEACAFDDVVGTGHKLSIYCDETETTTEKLIVQYYDSDGQWVRTQNGDGDWIDGEELTLPAAGGYTDAALECAPNGLVRVIKPKTNGTVRLYQKTIVGGALKPLAYYEPSETVPVYRRSLIPSLSSASCCGSQDGCETKAVTVIGKIRFIPVENDNDFLPISFAEAIRISVQAVAKERKDLLAEAVPYWQMANQLLMDQLQHYNGSGMVQPMRMVGAGSFGGGIPQLI